jgi:hypothetical protein
VATTIILCPGYVVYQKILAPPIPVLLSLPYVAFVIFLLKRKCLSFIFILSILALTFGFAILNLNPGTCLQVKILTALLTILGLKKLMIV